jgi:hypothetical protein
MTIHEEAYDMVELRFIDLGAEEKLQAVRGVFIDFSLKIKATA